MNYDKLREALEQPVDVDEGRGLATVDADALWLIYEAAQDVLSWLDHCVEVEVVHGGSYPHPHTGEETEAEPILRGSQIQQTRCHLNYGTYRLVPVNNAEA